MVPGMGHCGGGNGTSTFDMVAALDRLGDGGKAPAQSMPRACETAKSIARGRCARGRRRDYKGTGSIDDAANFVLQ